MGAWTSFAKDQMLLVSTGTTSAPTLYLALYSGSADPSGTPTELTLAGYARQAITFTSTAGNTVASAYDLSFGPLAAGAYQGVGLLDALTAGNLWFWGDETSSITIPNSSTVTFSAGTLTLTCTG